MAIARGVPGIFQRAMGNGNACTCTPEGAVGTFTHFFWAGEDPALSIVEVGSEQTCFRVVELCVCKCLATHLLFTLSCGLSEAGQVLVAPMAGGIFNPNGDGPIQGAGHGPARALDEEGSWEIDGSSSD